jgi:hypothetical protein
MKFLARFPGLILERDDYDDYSRYQLHGPQWSAFPFKCREKSSESNPLAKLTEILYTKDTDNTESEDSQKEEEDSDGGDNDTDEDSEASEDCEMDEGSD